MSREDSFDYSKHCEDFINGGQSICGDGDDCECYFENETSCLFGICVCLTHGHLAFDKIRCSENTHSEILQNATNEDLKCPRTCLSSSPNNNCPPPSKKHEDHRCYCPDNSLAIPRFTKDHIFDRFNVCTSNELSFPPQEQDNNILSSVRNQIEYFRILVHTKLCEI